MSGPSAEQAEQAAAPPLVAGSLADERVYGDDPFKPIQVRLEACRVLRRLGPGPHDLWRAHA